MAIRFTIEGNTDNLNRVQDMMHKALVGSPAYINNEILVSPVKDNQFNLIVGNDNANDVDFKVTVTELVLG